MRRNVERLLVWLVPALIVTFFTGIAIQVFREPELLRSTAKSLGLSTLELGIHIRELHVLILSAGNIVIAVWLSFQRYESHVSRAIWSFFGLASGLFALVIWLLVTLFDQKPAGGG